VIAPAATDDAALVARTLAGDDAAFPILMERHRAAVFRVLHGHVGDTDAALDLTQESFLAAWRGLARYDPRQPFRPWIMRIAINKARDRARRRAVRAFFTFAQPIEAANQQADPLGDIAAAAESREAIGRLAAAIATLPASLKEPLLLRAVEELSGAETARALGISEKAVEMRLYRARARLKEILTAGEG